MDEDNDWDTPEGDRGLQGQMNEREEEKKDFKEMNDTRTDEDNKVDWDTRGRVEGRGGGRRKECKRETQEIRNVKKKMESLSRRKERKEGK